MNEFIIRNGFTSKAASSVTGGQLTVTGSGNTSATYTAKFLNSSSANNLVIRDDGNVGIGVLSPSAFLHVLGTTEQLRVAYDVSNYYKTTVSSAGAVTFDAVGASAGFTFSDAVSLPNGSTAITQSSGDSSTNIATTAFVHSVAGGTTGQIVLTAAGGWPSTTNGATGITQVETATNKVNYVVCDFAQSVQSYIEWNFPLPADYNGGTITAVFYWLANSTSTNSVVWGCQGRAYANGDAIDQAFGTAQEVTQANTATANQVHISSASAAITLAGTPAASQHAQIRVYRLGSGSDTLAATARLLSVRLTYTKA